MFTSLAISIPLAQGEVSAVIALIVILIPVIGSVLWYYLYGSCEFIKKLWSISQKEATEKRPFYRRGQWSRGVGYQDDRDKPEDREP